MTYFVISSTRMLWIQPWTMWTLHSFNYIEWFCFETKTFLFLFAFRPLKWEYTEFITFKFHRVFPWNTWMWYGVEIQLIRFSYSFCECTRQSMKQKITKYNSFKKFFNSTFRFGCGLFILEKHFCLFIWKLFDNLNWFT